MYEVKLPQWGMNMTDGEIVKWLKNVGDHVDKGEPLVEIETAKAANVVEAPVAGTIVKILAEEEEVVLVQTVIAVIEPEAE